MDRDRVRSARRVLAIAGALAAGVSAAAGIHAAADPDGHRTTLTTFHLPSVQAPIVPLPSCGGAENPRYEPVTPYEWESRFIRKTYAERRYTVPDPAADGYLAALDLTPDAAG